MKKIAQTAIVSLGFFFLAHTGFAQSPAVHPENGGEHAAITINAIGGAVTGATGATGTNAPKPSVGAIAVAGAATGFCGRVDQSTAGVSADNKTGEAGNPQTASAIVLSDRK